MSDWYVDKGLATLIAQVRKRHPGIVVGTIAGGGHVATWPETDHAAEPDGSVDGADFMVSKAFTASEADEFVNGLVRNRDKRIAYIIWNRRIISSTPKNGYAAWEWRRYSGSNPHTDHPHVSVNDKHENDNSPWNIGGKMWKYQKAGELGFPILKAGDDDADYDGYNAVGRAQVLLNFLGAGLTVDGNYGPKMTAAVKTVAKTDGRTIDMPVWVRLAGLTRVV